MSWRIDVYDASGNLTGSGPITSATGWTSTSRMDRGGDFSFEVPMGDAKAQALAPLQYVRCLALVNDSWQEIGAGVVERIERVVGADGEIMARVSGADLVGLLSTVSVLGTATLDGSNVVESPQTPLSHAEVLDYLEFVSTDTPIGPFQFVPASSPPVDSLVGRWNYESLLQAMIVLAARTQTHFYYSDWLEISYTAAPTASGVRAVRAAAQPSGLVAAIAEISEIEDAAEIVTFLVPFGGGNADARLTINASTETPPAGYSRQTISAPGGAFVDALSTVGGITFRSRAMAWNDITPISSTDADIQAAANALYYQALRYLQQHSQPEKFYRLSLLNSPIVRPTQTIRVAFRDVDQGLEIDDDLIVLEATTEVSADGPRTTGLVVSTVDRWPESDTGAVVSRLASGQMYQAAPQLNANSYVISYTKPVDDAETATFRFRFDSEVVQLTRLTFDFQLLPLESTVKSLAGTASTTSSGGATSPTTSSGGSSTPTTSSGGATTSSSGGSSTPTTSSGGSSTPTTDSGSGHTHEINLANSTSGSAVYFAGTGSPPTGDFRTSGGGRVNTSSTGSGHTHSVTIAAHTHSVTIAAHTHTIGDHTHSVTVPSHTHSVTVPSHTHDYTPTITASYGIFRDSAGNTFGLTDIEYSVDGSTWYAFTVGVNGFASLGDGWYRVDLTALLQNSTTLRPTSNNNAVQVRRKSTGAIKKAMIEAQLNVRTIIQAIAAI